ncbi:dihydroorotate oxidase [Saprolegnia parasitica CBS 223.65]|uniref:Dihydroorotate dehydrogenase (quinone), mitochondrial n=1 Tax=Saprolegnia parasitica (strain CBS 223.65) TaxID=695850 RepID=A0A067BRA0_SAPPC|nr:dihydroorotate oxidase [Saprolegnia parasitica CBS 223.65]KDO21044.1 dihydroorotate oxidase [Saprolegnia parasitica CBS 223.65]|eukprot:XP_012208225.1 dihydroorotate oxidase [Saprolegnia parasitica CBS 223.65]
MFRAVARPLAAQSRRQPSARHMSSIPTGSSSPLTPLLLGVGAGLVYFNRQRLLKSLCDPVLMPAVRLFDPETAHILAVKAAKYGLIPKDKRHDDPSLQVTAFNLTFDNPLGIAAGFDKHAEAMQGLLDMGFGFVEIGSVTPLAQSGNPKPRVFRLTEDRGVINRYGFNSVGADVVQKRLQRYAYWALERPQYASVRAGPLGINLGKNKTSPSTIADYVAGVEKLGPYGDYLVINISSPNTPGLRSLQGKQELEALVAAVLEARNKLWKRLPLLVKIAPDLTLEDQKDIADVALALQIDGLIVSNTTISRPESLHSEHKGETGGLSGAPVKDISTKVLHSMYALTQGKIPLIGVGGVATGQDAYEKIRAGATLVQMYSCLVFDGPMAVPRIKEELAACLQRDGFASVHDAIGAAHAPTE